MILKQRGIKAMQLCQPHHDELVQAIKDTGLWSLVKEDAHKLEEAIQREQETGEETIESYDPFFAANLNIIDKAVDAAGLELLTKETSTEGGVCPICTLKEIYEEHIQQCTDPECHAAENVDTLENWCQYAAGAEFKYAKASGYISTH